MSGLSSDVASRTDLMKKKKEQLQRLNKIKSKANEELESGWNNDFAEDSSRRSTPFDTAPGYRMDTAITSRDGSGYTPGPSSDNRDSDGYPSQELRRQPPQIVRNDNTSSSRHSQSYEVASSRSGRATAIQNQRSVFIQSFNDMTGNPVAEKITIRGPLSDQRLPKGDANTNTNSSISRNGHSHRPLVQQQQQSLPPSARDHAHLASNYRMMEEPNDDDPFQRRRQPAEIHASSTSSSNNNISRNYKGRGQIENDLCQASRCRGNMSGDNDHIERDPPFRADQWQEQWQHQHQQEVTEVACLSDLLSESATATTPPVMMSIPRSNNDIWSPGTVYTDIDLHQDINARCARVKVSDRPLLCMSLYPGVTSDVVVGGSDHSCYSIDATHANPSPNPNGSNCLRAKEMYNKRSGHSEWVTSVAHLPNNNVLSVGMDSKICLWSASSRTSCLAEYTGVHFGSISKVLTDNRANINYDTGANHGSSAANIALTSGYDGKINIWSFPHGNSGGGSASATARTPLMRGGGVGRGASVSSIRAGGAASAAGPVAPVVATCTDKNCGPIVEMFYNQGHIFAGTREGGILIYDVSRGGSSSTNSNNREIAPYKRLKGHGKAVTNMTQLHDSSSPSPFCFVSSGADGLIRLWDSRLDRCLVQSISAHPSNNGTGRDGACKTTQLPSVTCLLTQHCCIISGGSDNLVNVIDIRCGSSNSSSSGGSTVSDCCIVNSWNYHKGGVYSMCSAGRGVIFTGDGAGMMHCYDIHGSGRRDPGLVYGVGVCDVGAIQCIGVLNSTVGMSKGGSSKHNIICAGDDGNVAIYNF